MEVVYHIALDCQVRLLRRCYKSVLNLVYLDEHMFDSTAVNNHIFTLIKCCCQSYVTIRMHHLSKLTNAKMHGTVIRKQFSKLVLFKHH